MSPKTVSGHAHSSAAAGHDRAAARLIAREAMIMRMRRFDFFAEAPQGLLERLAVEAQARVMPSGAMLWRKDDVARQTVFIELGMVKTGRLVRDAVFRTYGLFGEGDVLGLQDAERHDMDAVVLSHGMTGLFFPTRVLHEELTRYPLLMHAQMAVSRRGLEASRDKIDIASAGETAQRIAVLMRQLVDRYGRVQNDGGAQLPFRLTLEQIGEIVDAREETVSRVLARWQRTGLLKMDRYTCRFTTFDALEAQINQPSTQGVRQ